MIRRWIVCIMLVLLAGPALAAPADPPATDRREPVEITADRMEADDAAKTVIFSGNAVAKQGDVTITGDRLTIFAPPAGGDVERVLAEGHVRIVQGARVATGERAEYFRAEERIVLTGSPRVSEGANLVQGHEIVVFVKENRSVVKSGRDGRVNAVFTPQGEGQR
jgi:lipopolysaccharide export system protein LptA